MAAIHSFRTTFNKNGNITISFYEGTKRRDIKLVKGTAAEFHFSQMFRTHEHSGDEVATKAALKYIRKDYIFKKHPNNDSVFYPTAKSSAVKV
jgi:hypothetical protein